MTFDAGALIAFERSHERVTNLVVKAAKDGVRIAIPTVVVAQVWRDGARQARLSRLLRSRVVEIVAFDLEQARIAGALCGRTSTDDIVDASVVVCARRRHHGVVTSAPEDLLRLDPTLRLVVV